MQRRFLVPMKFQPGCFPHPSAMKFRFVGLIRPVIVIVTRCKYVCSVWFDGRCPTGTSAEPRFLCPMDQDSPQKLIDRIEPSGVTIYRETIRTPRRLSSYLSRWILLGRIAVANSIGAATTESSKSSFFRGHGCQPRDYTNDRDSPRLSHLSSDKCKRQSFRETETRGEKRVERKK